MLEDHSDLLAELIDGAIRIHQWFAMKQQCS